MVIKDSDPTSPQLVAVAGRGTSYESFTPSSVVFKTQLVNTNSTATKVTFNFVNNSGVGPTTITLNSLTASANFSLNTTGISGQHSRSLHGNSHRFVYR